MKIFIGCDEQFEENIDIQIESIFKNTNSKIDIKLLRLEELKDILWREKDPKQTTDSAFTRWLVPYLSNYQGWSLYMDSDMFCRDDVKKIFQLKNEDKTVMVVKNDSYHAQLKKFNGQIQTDYERKNWSSLILFNNQKCKKLNANYINTAKGLELHQFKWLGDEQIGELPKEWNYLVEVDEKMLDPKNVHWTLGGPWFENKKDVEYSSEWKEVKLYLQKNLLNQN
jgi:lipopolysaccharide biosynthesis glycosyltransferase